jgi:hypothetical protein
LAEAWRVVGHRDLVEYRCVDAQARKSTHIGDKWNLYFQHDELPARAVGLAKSAL